MNQPPKKPGWVIAVDGGGTKIAVAATKDLATADLSSAQLWQFVGTGSAHPATWSTASTNLLNALKVVFADLEDGAPWSCLYLALAGAGRTEDQQRVIDLVNTWSIEAGYPIGQIVCTGDIDPLLVPPDPQTNVPTIAVILGTGSVVATLDSTGCMIRAGGWGPLLGDQCSAGAIGLSALQCLTRVIDSGRGIAQSSPLVRSIADELHGDTTDIGLNKLIIETAVDRTRRAQLSLVVLQLAFNDQDSEALQILNQHIQAINSQIAQVSQRASAGRSVHLQFSGGLVDRFPQLVTAIANQCAQHALVVKESRIVQPLLAALKYATTTQRSLR